MTFRSVYSSLLRCRSLLVDLLDLAGRFGKRSLSPLRKFLLSPWATLLIAQNQFRMVPEAFTGSIASPQGECASANRFPPACAYRDGQSAHQPTAATTRGRMQIFCVAPSVHCVREYRWGGARPVFAAGIAEEHQDAARWGEGRPSLWKPSVRMRSPLPSNPQTPMRESALALAW